MGKFEPRCSYKKKRVSNKNLTRFRKLKRVWQLHERWMRVNGESLTRILMCAVKRARLLTITDSWQKSHHGLSAQLSQEDQNWTSSDSIRLREGWLRVEWWKLGWAERFDSSWSESLRLSSLVSSHLFWACPVLREPRWELLDGQHLGTLASLDLLNSFR